MQEKFKNCTDDDKLEKVEYMADSYSEPFQKRGTYKVPYAKPTPLQLYTAASPFLGIGASVASTLALESTYGVDSPISYIGAFVGSLVALPGTIEYIKTANIVNKYLVPLSLVFNPMLVALNMHNEGVNFFVGAVATSMFSLNFSLILLNELNSRNSKNLEKN